MHKCTFRAARMPHEKHRRQASESVATGGRQRQSLGAVTQVQLALHKRRNGAVKCRRFTARTWCGTQAALPSATHPAGKTSVCHRPPVLTRPLTAWNPGPGCFEAGHPACDMACRDSRLVSHDSWLLWGLVEELREIRMWFLNLSATETLSAVARSTQSIRGVESWIQSQPVVSCAFARMCAAAP